MLYRHVSEFKFMRVHEIARRLAKDESGATAIEYGLIATLIFLVIVGAVNLFANEITNTFNTTHTPTHTQQDNVRRIRVQP